MPKDEPHYFNRNFALGDEWYRSLFAQARPGQRLGEKSASYLASTEVPERLASLLPRARLIVQLRNPIERAYSDYCMLFRRGEVSARIEDHLDPLRAARGRFIADGEYAAHLSRWFSHYAREQFLVLVHDDICANPGASFDAVARFLSLEAGPVSNLTEAVKVKESPTLPPSMRRMLLPFKSMAAPFRAQRWFSSIHGLLARPVEYPPLPDELRKRLRDHYRSDVARLEHMLGRTVTWMDAVASS